MVGSHKKSIKELRRFGLSFGCAFSIIGGLLFWRDKPAAPWVLGIALTVAVLGLAAPRLLRPLETVLATALRVVMAVITYVVLFVAFFGIITPMGILVRLMGKDLLEMKLPSDKTSYWVAVEPDGPMTRPDKPY